MRVKPIADSLPGEHVVAVHPTMSPDAKAYWHRRLNLYTGRSLSDVALTSEQEGRAGRLATAGQMLSPGVVSGLEVTVDSSQADESFYNIAPGFGIAASGEDVNLPTMLRLDVKEIPVYAPSQFLADAKRILAGGGGSRVPAEETTPLEVPAGEETGPLARDASQALAARHEGPPLGKLIDPRPDLPDLPSVAELLDMPPVGILLLQPIVVELVGEFDPTDSCEADPRNYAFEDWQRADGARLLFYSWPLDWMPLPGRDRYWRNRIAYAIFNAERRNQPHELLPWEEVGVPIALVGFDAQWNLQFVDRHSVVREGGWRKRRTMFIPRSGNPFLWQVRLKQFAEQLAETDSDNRPAADLASQFRYLPPVGVLPRKAVELLTISDINPEGDNLAKRLGATKSWVGRNNFFPSTYRVDATPVPLEQLDMAMTASASMSPFDTFAPDRVNVLVPVPQAWFEPDLLKIEAVSPQFQQEIDRLTGEIEENLFRRKDARQKHRTLARAITGKEPAYEDADPDGDVPSGFQEPDFDTKKIVKDGKTTLAVNTIQNLRTRLEGKVAAQIMTTFELGQFDQLGLAPFINFLQAKVDIVSDRVDFGFLRVQTDIYRMRQLILNNVAATRLATSPVLASIAKGDSAVATKADIETFLKDAKDKLPKTKPAAAAPPPPAGAIGTLSSPSSRTALFLSATPAATTFQLSQAILAPQLSAISATTALQRASTGRLVAPPPPVTPTPVQIALQSPVVGAQFLTRTVTIAERIEESKAAEAKNYCVATKFDVIKGFAELGSSDKGIRLNTIEVPGVLVLPPSNENGLPKRETKTLEAIQGELVQRILSDTTDPHLDEARIFSIGVELLEHTISFLRAVEARIQDFKEIIETCRTALSETSTFLSQAEKRLSELEHDLAEARHDITVAGALLVDEENRINEINQRRDRVIREQVRFLAYQRPRTVDLNVNTPTRVLDPAIVSSPVPACLGHEATNPADLRSTIALLRESPVKWFPQVHPLLERLDRIEMLHQTIATAKQRAIAQSKIAVDPAKEIVAATRAGVAIQQAFFAQRSVVTQFRAQTAQIDLAVFANQNWKFAHDQAKEIVSLGDVIEADHGRSDLAQEAARALESISRIAGCLYTNFGSVLPAIRLDWVEAFSEFDRPVNFRNLAVLPRWHEIAFLDRREMQALVDWLYQQVDPLQPDAVALINDVVRICLLLASHAPVNQIIAGHVPKATVVQTGGLVELAVDHTKLRVGMSVLMYSATNEVVARGQVEDLGAGKAVARVVTAVRKDIILGPGARVHFAESRALEINPLTARKLLR
jgi:hypothetical protein